MKGSATPGSAVPKASQTSEPDVLAVAQEVRISSQSTIPDKPKTIPSKPPPPVQAASVELDVEPDPSSAMIPAASPASPEVVSDSAPGNDDASAAEPSTPLAVVAEASADTADDGARSPSGDLVFAVGESTGERRRKLAPIVIGGAALAAVLVIGGIMAGRSDSSPPATKPVTTVAAKPPLPAAPPQAATPTTQLETTAAAPSGTTAPVKAAKETDGPEIAPETQAETGEASSAPSAPSPSGGAVPRTQTRPLKPKKRYDPSGI
jgi:hypothetical protein